ncbi:B3 domain-containing transcription factor VRN1-like [Rhododendron vialii]|uniref:B3 domain-containing transcription factor VRN1-like n=1 Tax=Rhododendron vialii TaxID=182163 RepID=UPI00265F6A26|nr:B3 domain-containing transcription factor VRN1-like [Rhododendron vialii]
MGSSRPSSPVMKPSPPHFFKIIHSPHQNLKIPRKFATTYGKDLSNHVFLKVPSGMVWKVELIKSNEDAWLCNGWKEFAEHYSVCFGHFLVFRYDGDSSFHVIIFDMTASEIEYPFSATRGDEIDANHMRDLQVTDTEDIEEDDCGKITSTKLKLPIPNKKEAVKRQESRRGLSVAKRLRHCPFTVKKPFSSSNGKSRPLERAIAFRSANPYFTKIMSPSYVSTGYTFVSFQFRSNPSVIIQQIFFEILQYLPTEFSKENLSEKTEKVVLQSANGGEWPVKCHYEGRSRYFLYWKSFVQANNVNVGDVCVFELIKSSEPRLNVVIFR